MKKWLALLLAGAMAMAAMTACSNKEENNTTEKNETTQSSEEAKAPAQGETVLPQLEEKPAKDAKVAIIETSAGTIKMCVYPEYAPKAVENFLTHAENGYYDGLTFHRIIEGFIIQGGDPSGDGTGGESIWGEGFGEEISNNLHHFRGAVAMAKSSLPNSQGSQFYIVQNPTVEPALISQMKEIGVNEEGNGFSDAVIEAYSEMGGTPALDYNYTVFGQVFEGMDVVDKIAQETKVQDDNGTVSPENQPKIIKITVDTAENHFQYE